MKQLKGLAAALAMAVAGAATAGQVTLDFEGIVPAPAGQVDPDTAIGTFYAQPGRPGVSFSASALASRRSDGTADGGLGSFPATPSGATGDSAMYLGPGSATDSLLADMTLAEGLVLTGSVSFRFAVAGESTSFFVCALLGTECVGRSFSNNPPGAWNVGSFDVAGQASGLRFRSGGAQVAFDDLRFNTLRTTTEPPPPTGVPAPATLALSALALAGLGWTRRRRTA